MEIRLLYSRKAAAEMLSVSVRTLDYLISLHKLETRRIGRKLLITRDSLRKFAAADHGDYNRLQADPEAARPDQDEAASAA